MPAREVPPRLTAKVRLPAETASPGAARRFVKVRLDQWAVTRPVVDDILLLTSELVSNGVSHARSAMTLTVTLRDTGRLRVELCDDSPENLVMAPSRLDAERGRGLAMVAALATDWGVELLPRSGKVVWFELATAPAGAAAT